MAAIEGVDVIDMTFELADDECAAFDFDPELLLCFNSEVGFGLRTFSRESSAPPTPLLPDGPEL